MESLSPEDLASELGLQKILPPGRFNGFVNILKVIQSQLTYRKSSIPSSLKPRSFSNEQQEVSKDVGIAIEGGWKSTGSEEVAVLLSGGVDSSVALKLLQLEGRKVRANSVQTVVNRQEKWMLQSIPV